MVIFVLHCHNVAIKTVFKGVLSQVKLQSALEPAKMRYDGLNECGFKRSSPAQNRDSRETERAFIQLLPTVVVHFDTPI